MIAWSLRIGVSASPVYETGADGESEPRGHTFRLREMVTEELVDIVDGEEHFDAGDVFDCFVDERLVCFCPACFGRTRRGFNAGGDTFKRFDLGRVFRIAYAVTTYLSGEHRPRADVA